MLNNNSSQTGAGEAAAPIARDDVDALPAGGIGPEAGNAISGEGTLTGATGADTITDGPGMIVAVRGAGGEASSASGGPLQVDGQYGVLTLQADGSYSYIRSAGSPDGVQDVFTYTLADADSDRDTANLTILIGRDPTEQLGQLPMGAEGVVMLPAGVDLSDIRVVGRDLVVTLPDGSQMVIPGGAVFVPQLVIGDVEVPPANVAALLIDAEPQPAAGTPQSSGGNFEVPVAPLDPGVPLGDLIPPTELIFTPPEFEEVGQVVDEEPEIFIQPDGQPAVVNAVDSVDEAGLDERDGEPAGSDESADGNGSNGSVESETTAGVIIVDSGDGPNVVTIVGFDGVAVVAAPGAVIQGQYGTMTIVSVDGDQIRYTYTLDDNTSGNDTQDNFSVTVTDNDGDTATATLTIDIIDDVPTARPDTDSVAAGEFGPVTGNVITDASAGDAGDGDNGADTVGADDASVTSVSGDGGSDSSFNEAGELVVQGQYGVLTIEADGSYSYVRDAGTPGGVTDVFDYVITDGDGDTSTSTLTIDIGDVAPETGQNPTVLLDDDALPGGNPGGVGDDPDAANLTGTLEGSGGDGALTFTLQTTGAPSGFTYVAGPNGSVLVQQGGVTVLTVTVDSDTGEYSVTQNAPIAHAEGGDENNVEFTIGYEVSDADGDTATGSLTINVDDDTPEIGRADINAPTLTVDETDLDADASGDFSTLFTVDYGADGAGTTAFALIVTDGADSGLVDVATGQPILLFDNNGVVEGRVGGEEGAVAFTVAVSGTGTVTLDQLRPLDHPDATNPDDAVSPVAGSIQLEVTATDADGDPVSETVNIGGNLVFDDDGPSVTGATAGAGVTLDETDAGSPAGFPISANSAGAAITATTAFGTDGAGSVTYGLSLAGGVGSIGSGLATAIGDFPITLVQIDADTIEGQYENGGTQVAFTVEMNDDGTITVTQNVPLEHLVDGSSAAAHDDALDLSGLVNATVTVTDADDDSVTGEAAIGDNIVFEDDGPSINVTADADANVVLQTQDGDTIGLASDSDSSTADFSGVFDLIFDGGADGAAGTPSLGYTLGVAEQGVESGLSQSGAPIYLYVIGGVVVGSTSATEAGVTAGNTVFDVSVSGTGIVTLTQYSQIDHPIGSDPTATESPFADQIASIADDLITLTATSTITDNDGDTGNDSATVNIGANLEFADDGPAISVDLTGTLLEIDETDGETAPGEVDPVGGNLGTVTVSAATLLNVIVNAGADTPATLGYALDLSSQGVDSGLLLSSTDATIYLYNIDGTVYGSTSTTAEGVNPGNTAFTVSIDADTGAVTMTQFLAVEHGDTTSNDEDSDSIDLGALSVEVTVTDADGDTDTASADLGSIIRFEDDGPSVTQSLVTGTVDEDGVVEGADDGGTGDGIAGGVGDVPGESTVASGSVTSLFNSGSDAPLTYGLNADTSGLPALTSNGVPVTYAVAGNVLTASAGGETVFTFELDADGSWTFTLVDQLDHAEGGDENDLTIALGSIVEATDADGDSVTAVSGGLVITVDDDTPTASDQQVGGTVDEDGVPSGLAGGTGDVPGENTVVSGSVAAMFNSGADAPLTYGFGTDLSGLPALTSGGVPVTYAVVGSTLTASAGGNDVFTLELNADGSYTFTLLDQLDHPSLDGMAGDDSENDLLLELGSVIEATDADGDTVAGAADGLVITVDDDTPQDSGDDVVVQVDEDALAGGNPGGPGDDAGGAGPVVISLSTVFASGADAPLTYSLSTDTSGLPALTSNGVPVTYAVVGNTLTASAGGNPVFTVVVDADTGAATFTLLDQIDHATLDGEAGDDSENNLLIDLSSILEATDADGDTVGLDAGSAVVDVDDDTPVVLTQASVGGTVDEDGLDDGNPGGTGDVPGEDTTASGSVTTLFSAGADAPLTYSLSTDTSGLPALTSGGVAVTYAVVGDTLTASAGGEPVFTFVLDADGGYTFTLLGQLDHAAGGDENDLTIALGSIVEATDADGDTVTAGPNAVVITVDDDTPVTSPDTDTVGDPGTTATGNVITDAHAGDTGDGDDGADSAGADQPGTITAIASDNVPANSDDTFEGGVLEIQGQYGTLTIEADGDYVYTRADGTPGGVDDVFTYTLTDADGDSVPGTLTITLGDERPVATTSSATVDDEGLNGGIAGGPGDLNANAGETEPANPSEAIFNGTLGGTAGDGTTLFLFQNGLTGTTATVGTETVEYTVSDGGTLLTATVDGGARDGTVLFTVEITDQETGDYTVTLLDNVLHEPLNGAAGDNSENDASVSIDYQMQDADGDFSALPGELTITFDDDVPTASNTQLTGTVDEDGVTGGIAGGTGDVPGETTVVNGNVSTLFNSGADSTLTYSLLADTSGLPVLTSGGEPVTYSVVGNTLTATADGETVFTFTVNADTGAYTFTLEGPLDHATLNGVAGDNTENDLTIALGSIISATDADGDSVTANGNGLVITVDDDTPIATATQLTGTVDEDGVPSGIAGGPDDVPGESTVAMGSVTTLFQSGADAPLTYSLSTNTTGLPSLTSAGVAVTYAVVGNTLTASAGGETVFTFVLNADGSYTFTLVDQLDHATLDGMAGDNTENELLINLSSIIQATDADGDTVTAGSNGLVITVDDDSPVAFDPDPITTGVENLPGETATADLDADGQIEDNVGADQPGIIQFANITPDGMPSGLTSGGADIEYWLSNDGQTLEARINSTDGTDGTLIFQIDLNQDPNGTDTYTIEMFETIDNGAGTSFDDLTSTNAGNVEFRGVGADDPTTQIDLLLSAWGSDDTSATVNTDNDSIGSDNQSMDAGETVRIDFVTNLTSPDGATTPSGFEFDGHVYSNQFLGMIPQVQGNQAQTVDFTVYALDTTVTENDNPDRDPDGGFSDSTITEITEVTVIGFDTGEEEAVTVDISGAAPGDVVNIAYGISVTVNADGSVTFHGVQEGDQYGFGTGTGEFNAIAVEAHDSFDLGVFSIGVQDSGDPINLLFDLQLTDADGDTVVVDDALDITIAPDSMSATTLATMASQEPLADSSSKLMVSDSNVEQQLKTMNAANTNTVFLGAVAAAGLTAAPAAAAGREFQTLELIDTVDLPAIDSAVMAKPAVAETLSIVGGEGPQAVAGSDSSSNSLSGSDSSAQGPKTVVSEEPGTAQSQSQLSQGTDAPAQVQASEMAPVADSVAMPSAEALAAAFGGAVEGEAKVTGEVGRVLADALAGGEQGQGIDAMLEALAGAGNGADGAAQVPATAGLGDVPAWDNGALGHFSWASSPYSSEALALHQDADVTPAAIA